MVEPPAPGRSDNLPDQGKRGKIDRGDARAPKSPEEVGSVKDDPELPSAKAELHVVLMPSGKITFDARTVLKGRTAGLAVMGVIAPAATIYSAAASNFPPLLSAGAVVVELAIAGIVGRPAIRARRDRRRR